MQFNDAPTDNTDLRNLAEIAGMTTRFGLALKDIDSQPENNSTLEDLFEDDEDSIGVIFNPCQEISLLPAAHTICSGESLPIRFEGNDPIVAYSWNTTDGLSCTDCPNPIATPTVSTHYCVTITDIRSCTTTACTDITVSPLNGSVGAVSSICEGESTTLQAQGGVAYNWTPTIGLNNPFSATPVASPSETTTYSVEIINEAGCTDVHQVLVEVNNCNTPAPCNLQVTASSDHSICDGENMQLHAIGGTSWQWTPADGLNNPTAPNPIASPTQTTTYTVTARDQNGCIASDQVTIFVNDCNTPNPCDYLQAIACEDKKICEGDRTRLVVNGGYLWQWSPATGLDDPTSPAPYASPSQTTIYTVIVSDEQGCTATDQVIVEVFNCNTPPPCDGSFQVIACEDKTIVAGSSTLLTVTSGATYAWSHPQYLNDPTLATPFASPPETTTFTVTVLDQNGCSSSDEVTIFVARTGGPVESTDAVALRAKVYLQGAYLAGGPYMQDQLRTQSLIPLTEPYSDLVAFDGEAPPFTHVGGGGGETTSLSVLDQEGPDAIVDWVFLELRDAITPATVLATRAALLQRDGDIVDTDGVSDVLFNSLSATSYYIAVRHRNHLGVMTQQPVVFTPSALVDFTDVQQPLYQRADPLLNSNYPAKEVNGINCLWGGNSNADDKIIFQGPGLDQTKIFFDIFNHPENVGANQVPNLNYILKGYELGDNNMDGEVRYQGPKNDVDELQFFNVILHLENIDFRPNKIIYEQLPR